MVSTAPLPDVEVLDTISTLASGSVPLRHFCCTAVGAMSTNIKTTLHAIVHYMPYLYTLRLNIISISVGGSLDDNLFPTIVEVLSSFPKLKGLHIPCPLTIHTDYNAEQEAQELQIILECKRLCPMLEIIMLPSCVEWHYDLERGCWKRCNGQEEAWSVGVELYSVKDDDV
ncbi:hypothetical protein K439DRAFT_1612646 [Ramaria rubella]|nr:hypothetical protein K439DRAFT_1612646 [Ramaria rubella]